MFKCTAEDLGFIDDLDAEYIAKMVERENSLEEDGWTPAPSDLPMPNPHYHCTIVNYVPWIKPLIGPIRVFMSDGTIKQALDEDYLDLDFNPLEGL